MNRVANLPSGSGSRNCDAVGLLRVLCQVAEGAGQPNPAVCLSPRLPRWTIMTKYPKQIPKAIEDKGYDRSIPGCYRVADK